MAVQRIADFELWQEGYGGSVVTVYIAGTTTKASLFSDEALTVAAGNPQTLGSQTVNGVTYGKLAVPLYTSSPYTLDIDSTDQTGIVRPPLTSLSGENATAATVIAAGGSVANTLADIVARAIHVRDYGAFLPTSDPAASSATNNATLTLAIGAASTAGGGRVVVPDGTFAFTSVTLSGDVIITGQGRDVTVLQSQTADKVITLGGDGAGFDGLTLDGINLQAGSTGVFGKAINETYFNDFLIKRFETGHHMQGGQKNNWNRFFISNCATGAKYHGDNDAAGGADGDEFRHNAWVGGKVDLCTTIGVQLSFVDKKCYHNMLRDVGFESNTGTALDINGARYTNLYGCWFSGNTTALAVDDDSDTTNELINTVVGLHMVGGYVSGGAATFQGKCQDIILDGVEIADVDFTLTLPKNNIVLRDCIEDSLVTISGDGTKFTRERSMNGNPPGSSGVTTDATPTKTWSVELEPGQVGHIRAVVLGNQRDGTNQAIYHISRPVHRPGSTLAYDAQTTNFTSGDILTGGTSGATARIIADSDSGSSGTLTLRDIVGTFENNETIADGLGGSASVNGTITNINAALLGSTASITAAFEDVAGWAADFAASGSEIEIQVTGAASTVIEWIVHAEVVAD